MEDKNQDAKQLKKDAKREARIEAKRRKLAEQRASRMAQNSDVSGSGQHREWYDADREVIQRNEPVESGKAELHQNTENNPAVRQVTADSANRERHIDLARAGDALAQAAAAADRIPAETAAESYGNEPEDIQSEGTAAGTEENAPEDIQPDGAAAEPAGNGSAAYTGTERAEAAPEDRKLVNAVWKNRSRSADRSVAAGALAKTGNILSRITDKNARWRRISPKYAATCAVALVVLIGIIYGALEIADYNDKKTDYFVTDEGFSHAKAFEDCIVLNGIDVSVHQKGEINWEKAKTSGVDFVFVRAGYRAADNGTLHADENFASNVRGAQKAGLMVGAYFYSQALTPGEGKEEAEFVLDMLKGYDMTMPIAIDYEIYKDGRLDQKIQAGELYAASFYHDIVLGFTNTVEAAGYESVVYASWDMLNNYMQADLIDDMATIWLSKYDSEAGLDAEYWFWQCSDEGKVGGIEDKVDKNFWYIQPEKVYPTRAKHKKNAVSIGDCSIIFRKDTFTLRNFRAEPKFAMTYEGKEMKEGRDYVSSVVHNTKEGTGYVIIRGTGKYKDWIMYPFGIE